MSKVRVIRVLEYTFPDAYTAEEHLKHTGVQLNGTTEFGNQIKKIVVRSAVVMALSDFVLHEDEEDDPFGKPGMMGG